ncbi:MAG: hypothetical protein QOF48_1565 [Verrucomicrobiota bacterium]|jgi:hypothetical protein
MNIGESAAGGMDVVSARSTSGQFIVRGIPQGTPRSRPGDADVSYLRLDPMLTAVSLERIKQNVHAALNLPDKWRGLITVTTFPAREDDAAVRVTSVHYADGWGYGVELPEVLDKARFVRCAVGVLLAEFANRNALARESELPPWLAEGLAAQLDSTIATTLALEPGKLSLSEARGDPLRKSRELIRQRGALTFSQLSLPGDSELSDANRDLYRACSHVLVHELLRLRDGRESLRDMLEQLPAHLNWQAAFLRAFHNHFPRLIEADKWYMLAATHISERDALSVWPLETSFAQLDDLLATSVQVRTSTNDLPILAQVKLQRIISEWEPAVQTPVLEQKLAQFEVLRRRAAAALVDIVTEYELVVGSCARGRVSKARNGKPRFSANSPALVREALKRLDQLDRRLQALRNQLQPAQ